MSIVRNADGTLLVPVQPDRVSRSDEADGDRAGDRAGGRAGGPDGDGPQAASEPTTRLLHPGEGGFDEALVEWDLEQNPDGEPAVSTVSGRQEAMTLVHALATSSDHAVAPALEALHDPEASGEALRHVLVGGVHAVEDFATEVAHSEGGDTLTAHQTTKIIGEVLSELD